MIYFRLGSTPELRRFPHKVRVGILNHWRREKRLHSLGETCVALSLSFPIYAINIFVSFNIISFFHHYGLVEQPLLFHTVILLFFLIIPLPFILFLRTVFLRFFLLRYIKHTWLNGRAPVCYACTYDLTGSPGSSCPECGMGVPQIDPARFPYD